MVHAPDRLQWCLSLVLHCYRPTDGITRYTIAAISPSVTIPTTLSLYSQGYGRESGVPTLIVGAASLDVVIVISLFGIFLGLAFSDGESTWMCWMWGFNLHICRQSGSRHLQSSYSNCCGSCVWSDLWIASMGIPYKSLCKFAIFWCMIADNNDSAHRKRSPKFEIAFS